jgi:hypothetical protein
VFAALLEAVECSEAAKPRRRETQEMRNGQNKRMRGRNRRGHNPLTRVYESNGPDVKIRGTAHHIAEKYLQLARDAQTSGDPVAAEGYLQHAEHYFRMIAAAQAQFAPQHQQHNPNQPQQPYQRPDVEPRDDFEDDGDDSAGADQHGQPYPSAPVPQQPMQQPRPQHQPQPNFQGYQQQQPRHDEPRDPGLPAFITGGGGQGPSQGNGYDNEQGGDRDNRRFHRGGRNRRFHRGGRNDYDPQRVQGGGEVQGQNTPNTPGDVQPSGEFSPPKTGE